MHGVGVRLSEVPAYALRRFHCTLMSNLRAMLRQLSHLRIRLRQFTIQVAIIYESGCDNTGIAIRTDK